MMKKSIEKTIPDTSRRRFTAALGLAAAGLAFPSRSLAASLLGDTRRTLVRHSTFVMGQIANVTILHQDRQLARQAVTDVFNEFRRLDALLSVYDSASEVSAINRAAGKYMAPVSDETRSVIAKAAEISRHWNGALDITINPLLKLWGFRGDERPAMPADAEVHAALDVVGMRHLQLESGGIGLDRKACSIDLGGVAVGYALDRAAALLRSRGIDSALIELSGDYYAIGTPADDRRGWEIGIVDPRRDGAILKRVHIKDQALSTSGNYATTVVYNAKSYGHIFNPDNGYPSDRILSATVIAPTGFDADAGSTALFVHGNTDLLPKESHGIII